MLIELNSREQVRIRYGKSLYYLQGIGDGGVQLTGYASILEIEPVLDEKVSDKVIADHVFIHPKARGGQRNYKPGKYELGSPAEPDEGG